jgi:hypothetical protein
MRHILFLIATFFFVNEIRSQQSAVISDTTYFRRLYNIGHVRTLTKDSLVAAPSSAIPQNFADTLKKYDWLLLQNVDNSGHMNNFFAFPPCVRCYYNVMRIDTGVANHLLTNQLNGTVLHEIHPNEGHFNGTIFRNDTNLLLTTVYRKNNWSGVDYRQYEMKRILSYTNGLLIIDQLDYTQVWHPIVIRSVYLRIERIPK